MGMKVRRHTGSTTGRRRWGRGRGWSSGTSSKRRRWGSSGVSPLLVSFKWERW